MHEEILRSRSIGDLAQARFTITSVATQYIKPTVTPYLQRLLHEHIIRVVDAPDLDLTTDPADVRGSVIRILTADLPSINQ